MKSFGQTGSKLLILFNYFSTIFLIDNFKDYILPAINKIMIYRGLYLRRSCAFDREICSITSNFFRIYGLVKSKDFKYSACI